MSRALDPNPQYSENGSPVVGGKAYFGIANTDPEVLINQIPIFSDRGTSVPLANPVDTDAQGRLISPVYVAVSEYSYTVNDNLGNQLLTEPLLEPLNTLGLVTSDQDLNGFGFTNVRDAVATDEFATLGQLLNGDWLFANSFAGSTQDAIIVDVAIPPDTLNHGQKLIVYSTVGISGSATPTLTLNPFAAKTIVRWDSEALAAGEMRSGGSFLLFAYDQPADVWQLLNPYTIAGTQYRNDSIAQAAMALLSVGTPELIDLAVNQAKLALLSVGNGQLINNSVGVTKLEDMSAATFLGQILGGSGDPVKMSAAQAKTALAIVAGDITGLGTLATNNTVPVGAIAAGAINSSGMFATDVVDQAAIGPAAVARSELETVSFATAFSVGAGGTILSFDNNVNDGGEYTFGPTDISMSSANHSAFIFTGAGHPAGVATGPLTTICMAASGEGAGSTVTGSCDNRYVDASPPYDLGNGEIDVFVWLRLNAEGDITGMRVSHTPPWVFNGPTKASPDRVSRVVSEDGSESFVKKFVNVQQDILLPPWKGGDLDKWEDSINNPKMVEVEIDQAVKNADMDLIPHPFVTLREGEHVILIDPTSSINDTLANMHRNKKEKVIDIFMDGYVDFSESANSVAPSGVEIRKAKWKLN